MACLGIVASGGVAPDVAPGDVVAAIGTIAVVVAVLGGDVILLEYMQSNICSSDVTMLRMRRNLASVASAVHSSFP